MHICRVLQALGKKKRCGCPVPKATRALRGQLDLKVQRIGEHLSELLRGGLMKQLVTTWERRQPDQAGGSV